MISFVKLKNYEQIFGDVTIWATIQTFRITLFDCDERFWTQSPRLNQRINAQQFWDV